VQHWFVEDFVAGEGIERVGNCLAVVALDRHQGVSFDVVGYLEPFLATYQALPAPSGSCFVPVAFVAPDQTQDQRCAEVGKVEGSEVHRG
jgi:hypothetical protein